MAGIHSLSDFRNENRGVSPQSTLNQGNQEFQFFPSVEEGDPRKYGNCETLQHLFCPFFRFLSFVVLISLFDILIYLLTLAHSAIAFGTLARDQSTFLGPCTSSLITFGAKVYTNRDN